MVGNDFIKPFANASMISIAASTIFGRLFDINVTIVFIIVDIASATPSVSFFNVSSKLSIKFVTASSNCGSNSKIICTTCGNNSFTSSTIPFRISGASCFIAVPTFFNTFITVSLKALGLPLPFRKLSKAAFICDIEPVIVLLICCPAVPAIPCILV